MRNFTRGWKIVFHFQTAKTPRGIHHGWTVTLSILPCFFLFFQLWGENVEGGRVRNGPDLVWWMGLAESSAPVGMLVQCHDVGVKRSFAPFDTGLLRTACSHNPQKHSQSAHFSAKNGFLLMFLAGPKIKNLHASKLASDFQPFDPGIMSFG